MQELALYYNHGQDADAFALSLQFSSGAVGTLQLNSQRIWWRNYDRIELTGEGEYIVLDGLWSVRHYTQARNTFTENYSDERSGELTGDGHALNEFVAAIREGRQPLASIQDSVQTMKLYQVIYDAVLKERKGVISTSTPPRNTGYKRFAAVHNGAT